MVRDWFALRLVGGRVIWQIQLGRHRGDGDLVRHFHSDQWRANGSLSKAGRSCSAVSDEMRISVIRDSHSANSRTVVPVNPGQFHGLVLVSLVAVIC
jgi:hypothetical protein